ncbi:hypothetical protein B0H34DRAFT_706920 [Crassisporium funariophilum]|nr:hypothetical protein B0H34DRAFT_706920 [Crassisporium funariophilum]
MTATAALLLLYTTPTLTYALDLASGPSHVWKRTTTRNVPVIGFNDPRDKGGSWLTKIPVTYPMGQGEPLNAIITGNSDERVLKDIETDGGLRNYFLSLGFSGECLGQHAGSDQAANLGDGNGYKNETSVIRWNYGDPQLGACRETVEGGNHFRYWAQNGPEGNTGSIFMAVSYELPLNLGHDIIVDGYNLGRDWLIGNITRSTVPTRNLTNTTTYSGTTTFANYTYQSDIKYVSGLLEDTNDGINHNLSVSVGGVNSVDGLVAVIDVKITESPVKSIAWKPSPPRLSQLLPLAVVLILTILPLSACS